MDISQSVDLYNSELRSILDFHTPLSTHTVTVRPAAPWYSNEIKIKEGKKRQKKTKNQRQLERFWRKSRLPQDRLSFTEHTATYKADSNVKNTNSKKVIL